MEGEGCRNRSIIDELQSWDILVDKTECESGVTPSTIDEHHSSDMEEDQMVGESGVTRSIIDEIDS